MADPPEHLSPDVRRFILTSVPSVPFLEAMLLMRADRIQHWDAPRMAKALYTRRKAAADLLQQLCDAGIAAAEGTTAFAYRPASDDLAQRLDALAGCYTTHLVAVTDLIHSRTERRAQQFADAFRWKKED
ncbi:hypothetical protein [Caenimonas aquaedulcis]|uniref:Uncharacterized protein n=1 Tax=Caenimonas aquaedulcis TaxID=2793270 RepID=A0A931H4M4_9BURK|nr:hypothetical protein [Caenimonas aquaedulcis]MBG9388422.1 hypothetical protein [Caenimonas aquaedulcis]